MSDFIEAAQGRLHVYAQNLEGGYSAPGQEALTETQTYGGELKVPITEQLDVTAKADWQKQDDGLEIRAEEVDVEPHDRGAEVVDEGREGAQGAGDVSVRGHRSPMIGNGAGVP